MRFNKIFKNLGVCLMIMVPAACFACDGKTQLACVAQTSSQNTCVGQSKDNYCTSLSSTVTQHECEYYPLTYGMGPVMLTECTWSTRKSRCTWTNNGCS